MAFKGDAGRSDKERRESGLRMSRQATRSAYNRGGLKQTSSCDRVRAGIREAAKCDKRNHGRALQFHGKVADRSPEICFPAVKHGTGCRFERGVMIHKSLWNSREWITGGSRPTGSFTRRIVTSGLHNPPESEGRFAKESNAGMLVGFRNLFGWNGMINCPLVAPCAATRR
jgi:hypothetical protein